MPNVGWQEKIKWIINSVHAPVNAAALSAQKWSTNTSELLLTMTGLKSIVGSNIEKRYQLITSGVADLLYATLGGWMIWQAYNLNAIVPTEKPITTTLVPATTEADLPTFSTLPDNDERFYVMVSTENEVTNELKPEMITIMVTQLFSGGNGIFKIITGLLGFDYYRIQKIIKINECFKALSNLVTVGINFKDSNIQAGSLMMMSSALDFINLYYSPVINVNINEKIIMVIMDDKRILIRTEFPLYNGILSNQSLNYICQKLEKNDWHTFKLEHSNKLMSIFFKPEKIQDWKSTFDKFKEWIEKYMPKDKKIAINLDDTEIGSKLIVPNYEIGVKFIINSNNDFNSEFSVNSNERQPLLTMH